MDLVIKIPEEIYNHTQEYEVGGFNQENDIKLFMAIKNGIPLPEGHGKLKYEEDILSVIMFSKLFDNAKVGEVKEALLNIPTIIEADGGGE